MYLSEKLIEQSFFRLGEQIESDKKKKIFMERTSALMYFLAFDTLVKSHGASPINFDPTTVDGAENRKAMALEYSNLATFHHGSDGTNRSFFVLGHVELDKTEPERRISSNFYTVPLKKASESLTPCPYPKRPAPILFLGKCDNKSSWGIDYHPDWKTDLPLFLCDIKSSAHFTDLAIVVLRYRQLQSVENGLFAALSEGLRIKYTESLSAYLIDKIRSEKILWKNTTGFEFQNDMPKVFVNSTIDKYHNCDKGVLIKRIQYLESVLNENDIRYQP